MQKRSVRIAILVLAVLLTVTLLAVVQAGVQTIRRLEVVEAERDHWQRPADVISALNLKNGSVVVDLGSGAGYFALRLSALVGPEGKVLAVDIRKLSLLFLKIRAVLQRRNNISVIVGDLDDPHLPRDAVDSVLIANTYHELTAPRSILRHVSNALHPGGRIVVLDRGPGPDEDPLAIAAHHHALPEAVETELREEGFETIRTEGEFINQPGDENWWLVVARKP
ncbi:MAG TPA: methyltransferase domain-containing protein [Terriglobia bacterium]|nr:methyltransferase domain-containing protein [Terriglobia bacterium]